MQLGVDSFAAAVGKDQSPAAASERLRNLVE